MGKSYARFVEQWVQLDFGAVIRPGILASVSADRSFKTLFQYLILLTCDQSFALFPASGPGHDAASRTRFENKVGPARMKELGELAQNHEWREELYERARQE
jgi:hypothetical protein